MRPRSGREGAYRRPYRRQGRTRRRTWSYTDRSDLGLSRIDFSGANTRSTYFTYAPRVGRNDAERNCILNIRPAGLNFDRAAHKLFYLMTEARSRKLSGVKLKDQADSSEQTLEGPATERNFLSGDAEDSSA